MSFQLYRFWAKMQLVYQLLAIAPDSTAVDKSLAEYPIFYGSEVDIPTKTYEVHLVLFLSHSVPFRVVSVRLYHYALGQP